MYASLSVTWVSSLPLLLQPIPCHVFSLLIPRDLPSNIAMQNETQSLGNNGIKSSFLHQELLPSGVKEGFECRDIAALYI